MRTTEKDDKGLKPSRNRRSTPQLANPPYYLMFPAILFLLVLVAILAILRTRYDRALDNAWQSLRPEPAVETFDPASVAGLPEPARRYLLRAIALGTPLARCAMIEMDGRIVIGSREALELREAPKRLVVIGGGAIGLEFASMYQKLGSSVTIVELMDQLLPGSDPEVVRLVQRKLESRGAKVYLKSKVSSLKRGTPAAVAVDTPDGKVSVEADAVLQSVGRKPRTEKLSLEKLGLKVDSKGFIVTDERMMTNVEGVFAIGDVRGPPLLAHKASKEGLVAAEVAAGKAAAADWTVVPDAVFCDPEVASVGLTERAARDAGHQIRTSIIQLGDNERSDIDGRAFGLVKLVATRYVALFVFIFGVLLPIALAVVAVTSCVLKFTWYDRLKEPAEPATPLEPARAAAPAD